MMALTKRRKRRKRSPNLTDDAISRIVSIIENWSGGLSWELLVARVNREFHADYTRQALAGHDDIQSAFTKWDDAKSDNCDDSEELPELRAALGKIASLEAEVARLKGIIDGYIEERVRWIYNASIRNLTEVQLSQEIPSVDRRQTKVADKNANGR